jgi:hypothetical protein
MSKLQPPLMFMLQGVTHNAFDARDFLPFHLPSGWPDAHEPVQTVKTRNAGLHFLPRTILFHILFH